MKLAYGLKDGRLTHIDVVDRGKACGCVCPACGAPLVAHKGEKVAHHFKHQGDQSCPYVTETTLHLLAKEIVEEGRTFRIPIVRAEAYADDLANERHIASREITKAHRQLTIDRVWSEHVLGAIVPDLVIEAHGKKLLVEIAVTHFVDEAKLAKIRALGISTIEVDLSRLDRMASRVDVRKAIRDVGHMTWLFNRRQEEVTRELEREAAEKAEESNQQIRTAIELAEQWARAEAGGKKPLGAQGDYYQHRWWPSLRSGVPEIVPHRHRADELPPWLGVPVTGDYIFACPREIWQGVICYWLENRSHRRFAVTAKKTASMMTAKHVPIHEEFVRVWTLKNNPTPRIAQMLEGVRIPSLYTILQEYINVLVEHGKLIPKSNGMGYVRIQGWVLNDTYRLRPGNNLAAHHGCLP